MHIFIHIYTNPQNWILPNAMNVAHHQMLKILSIIKDSFKPKLSNMYVHTCAQDEWNLCIHVYIYVFINPNVTLPIQCKMHSASSRSLCPRWLRSRRSTSMKLVSLVSFECVCVCVCVCACVYIYINGMYRHVYTRWRSSRRSRLVAPVCCVLAHSVLCCVCLSRGGGLGRSH